MQPKDITLSLDEEAEYLHKTIFGFAITDITAARYRSFLTTLGSAQTCATTAKVVALRLDPEAVCAALKRESPHHPLELRLHGLLYICETQSRYQTHFYLTHSNRGRAWLAMFWYACRSIWKSAKGHFLIRYYGLL